MGVSLNKRSVNTERYERAYILVMTGVIKRLHNTNNNVQ